MMDCYDLTICSKCVPFAIYFNFSEDILASKVQGHSFYVYR